VAAVGWAGTFSPPAAAAATAFAAAVTGGSGGTGPAAAAAAATATSPRARGAGPQGCVCVWHSTFGGTLRSDVTCGVCNYCSVTADPFLDISLEVPHPEPLSQSGGGGGGGESGGGSVSLHACLRRYTRAERLGASERIQCARCGGPELGSKQMSLLRLPPVLCLHLKRFRHHRGGGGAVAVGTKTDLHVSFPLDALDLTPYCAPTLLAHKTDYRILPTNSIPGEAPLQPPLYWLAAVVCHSGKMDGGHYTAYVRAGAEWFRADDACVSPAPEAEVAAAQAYMLLYCALPPGGAATAAAAATAARA
jgi:ubiquitin carboxyl-terminal hydrolase 22/27/51